MDPNFLYTLSNIVPRPQGKPVGDYSSSVTVRVLPLIGRVHIVNDACGLFQVGFVLVYWVYGTFSTLYIILLPQYNDARVPSWVVTSEYLDICGRGNQYNVTRLTCDLVHCFFMSTAYIFVGIHVVFCYTVMFNK